MTFKFRTEAEAVSIANDSIYGLGSSIISKDIDRARSLALKVDSGSVFINDIVKTDSKVPFGGNKSSGHGRECGDEGIKEFSNQKTIYIA